MARATVTNLTLSVNIFRQGLLTLVGASAGDASALAGDVEDAKSLSSNFIQALRQVLLMTLSSFWKG
jgi:hypothetical protein